MEEKITTCKKCGLIIDIYGFKINYSKNGLCYWCRVRDLDPEDCEYYKEEKK